MNNEMQIELGKIPGTEVKGRLILEGIPLHMDVATLTGISEVVKRITRNIDSVGTTMTSTHTHTSNKRIKISRDTISSYWKQAKGKPTNEKLKIAQGMGIQVKNVDQLYGKEYYWKSMKYI